jgi:hypothetical protein
MDIVTYKTEKTRRNLTSRSGLMAVGELIKHLGTSERIDQLIPKGNSNRAYKASEVFNAFMLLLHDGGKCLDDVEQLNLERKLMNMMGMKRVPSAKTLGNWLRTQGGSQSAMDALNKINQLTLRVGLQTYVLVTLDIDATVIESHKWLAKCTYKNYPGYVPMVGHIAETGQVVAVDFREGNAPPNKENLEFIRHCERMLPDGVSIGRLRIDAAGYQCGIIRHCQERGVGFAIRARMDESLKDSISAIKENEWQPMVSRDGVVSDTEQVARTVHVMSDSGTKAFCLVVQRQLIGSTDPDPQEELFPGLLGDVDESGARDRKWMYRAIATNLDEAGLTDQEIVHFYNQRGDASENRIKELRSDFAAAKLPCGDFGANAVYFLLCAIAYNLLALMRMILPAKWKSCRAPTFRHRLYARAGMIVTSGRQWKLKMRAGWKSEFDEVIWSIRSCVLS